MDIIDRHFAAENAHDIPATVATYAEDVVWDDVSNPTCPVQGKSAAAEMYAGVMAALPDVQLEPVARWSSGDHVVDESLATAHVHGSFAGVEGLGAPVQFRILHVFDIRDGLIAREQAWFDTGSILRQIEAHRSAL
jgi:steroid delta-isomerase-like uncharacterized protein